LADFGVSGWLTDYRNKRIEHKTFVGTPCWMAPEVLDAENGYDEKADIWSFGITMLELAKGRAPYATMEPMKAMLQTLKEDPPSLESYGSVGSEFSKEFKKVLSGCLVKDPKKRFSATKLLKLDFFKKRPRITFDDLLLKIPDIDADTSSNSDSDSDWFTDAMKSLPGELSINVVKPESLIPRESNVAEKEEKTYP
jgi:serine/threonine-protein kinase OSR1/STK39